MGGRASDGKDRQLSQSKIAFGAVLAPAIVFGLQSNAAAGIELGIASTTNADIAFTGTGSAATFSFNNNTSGQGFEVTTSSGSGDSIGLYGTISQSFTYSSVGTNGNTQTASVSTVGSNPAILTITDSSHDSFTATIQALTISTTGTSGGININGSLNLSNASYAGTNSDLTALYKDIGLAGGIAVLSFQFIPAESLTASKLLARKVATYSGTIFTAGSFNGGNGGVPEPTSLSLACIGLGTIIAGVVWRRRASRA